MATSSGTGLRIRLGRGRGHFLRILQLKKCQLADNVAEKKLVQPKSTYIPDEIHETDDSIYDTGTECGINFDQLDDSNVKVGYVKVHEVVENFDSITTVLKKNIEKCKFKKPTPIQKYTIPVILSGQDIMAAAQTGSGKTVAYVLPIVHKLIEEYSVLIVDNYHCEPQAIIMAPTRELAIQIHLVVTKLIRNTVISSLVCYGGTMVVHQMNQILKGCHILVATPGRLNEFIQYGLISFESVQFLVLDEVDKLLDIETKVEIDKIIDHFTMPSSKRRQTVMLSATLPKSIQNLASLYLKYNYVFLSVGTVNSASKDIIQQFHRVTRDYKRFLLQKMLKRDSRGTIVFVNSKWMADFLATYLSEYNIPTTSIHGDRSQQYRELALKDFSTGEMNVLVTTAVISRGLDIKCVQKVINYDLPELIEEYIQRIGRTGRLGNLGTAISFFDGNVDNDLIVPIINVLKMANQKVPHWLRKPITESDDDCEVKYLDKNKDIRIQENDVILKGEDW